MTQCASWRCYPSITWTITTRALHNSPEELPGLFYDQLPGQNSSLCKVGWHICPYVHRISYYLCITFQLIIYRSDCHNRSHHWTTFSNSEPLSCIFPNQLSLCIMEYQTHIPILSCLATTIAKQLLLHPGSCWRHLWRKGLHPFPPQ